MKRLLLPLIVLATSYYTNGQTPCTATAPDATGVYPSTFPDACEGTAYSEVISFVIPNDTCTGGGGAPPCFTFVSAKINSVTLPAGLTLEMPNSDSTYTNAGGTHTKGCFTVTGTPTTAGASNISIDLLVTTNAFNYPYTYDANVTVYAAGTNGCPVISGTTPPFYGTLELSAYPNPAKTSVSLNQSVTGTICDIMGNALITVSNSDQIDLSGLASGIYILNSDKGTIRITKE